MLSHDTRHTSMRNFARIPIIVAISYVFISASWLVGCTTHGATSTQPRAIAATTRPDDAQANTALSSRGSHRSHSTHPDNQHRRAPGDGSSLSLDAQTDVIEDGGDNDNDYTDSNAPNSRSVHPWAHLSDAQLAAMYENDPTSVGSMSLGATNAGALINGVVMPQGPYWEVNDTHHAWGTQETVEALVRCIEHVNELFPSSERMRIGHISRRTGGPLSPHVSHQAGRDVDVSYYYTKPARWFARAHAGNLDTDRTWAFVKALITLTDVEMILIDHSLQRLLRQHAERIGENKQWLDDIFRGTPGVRPALIRHARGHATHIHIRFYSPIARETARRLWPVLSKARNTSKAEFKASAANVDSTSKERAIAAQYVMYRAKSGDTLGSLANRFGTTVPAIQQANGLRTTRIEAKRTYRIPTTVQIAHAHQAQQMKAQADRSRRGKKANVRGVDMSRPVVAPSRRMPP